MAYKREFIVDKVYKVAERNEFTNVIVILAPDPASSDTKIDLTTAVFAVGTVYRVVRSVVVKSTFLLIKLLAIIVKRN